MATATAGVGWRALIRLVGSAEQVIPVRVADRLRTFLDEAGELE